ncbi:MAG: sulfotransferase [Phycisphaeraceae bacterium]|nr:MAG: sulfotransferase [Phycisphaeraceae bacterium]
MTIDFEQAYLQWKASHEVVDQRRKLFIVGCAKSGTTWMLNLLNGHDEVVISGEGGFAWRLLPILSQAFNAFNQHQRDHGHNDITILRDFELMAALRSIIDGQFVRYLGESGKEPSAVRIVGDKTPQHSVGIPVLNQLYPDALFMHVVRDPRDVAVSAWHHFGRDMDNSERERFARQYMTETWPINVTRAREAGTLLGDRYTEVRYEDLHADEPDVVARVLRFIGVDDSEEAVGKCMNSGCFKKRSGGRNRGEEKNNEFLRRGVVGDWVNHLPADAVRQWTGAIADTMQSFGYDPAGTPGQTSASDAAAA